MGKKKEQNISIYEFKSKNHIFITEIYRNLGAEIFGSTCNKIADIYQKELD